MMETFLCFESKGAFFLIPLKLVRHIVQGKMPRLLVFLNGSDSVRNYEMLR